jgi:hypothetical protein
MGLDHPLHLRSAADQPAEDLQERQVRQWAVGQVDTLAAHHPPSAVHRQIGQLAQQPGLADAGVAGQQDQPGPLAGILAAAGQVGQSRELGGSSDQRCHAPIIATRPRLSSRPA